MKKWAKISLAGLGAAGAGVGFALSRGASNWKTETARQVEELKGLVPPPGAAKKLSPAVFDKSLPAPVARYFRFALPETQAAAAVAAARIRHAGEFNLGGKWVPFESEQFFSARPPAFVWDAKMSLNPVMSIRVRDGYRNGEGSMTAKFFGLVTVASGDSQDERLAKGALLRFLAESVWQPTALLPGENLRWSPIDDNRATATLTDAGLTVSLDFIFNDVGEITGIFAPERFKEMKGGSYEPFPWAGRFWDYGRRGGMMIPLKGEVEWRMPGGAEPYWRGRVTEAEYESVK